MIILTLKRNIFNELENSFRETGIRVTPEAKKELEEKKLFQIKLKNIEFKREFYLVYHKEKSKNLLFETLIKFLKSRFI